MTNSPSSGLPTGRAATRLVSRAAKSSATFASTITRSVDMQICPALAYAPNTVAFTAASRSASSSTTSGALPPSSSRMGLRYFAAIWANNLPTRVEPVKLMRFTAGCAITASLTVPASLTSVWMTLTTPSPSPASMRVCPINWWVCGQTSDDLRITVLPQASGMASARTPRITGAFHGAMPNTTPTGWRCAMARLPGTSEGTTSPDTCVVIDAASRSIDAAKCTLKCPQPAVEPVSSRTAAAKSAARASRRSAALLSLARRAPGPCADHAGNAAWAAATAARASSTDAAAARVTTLPLTGLRRSKVAPARAGCGLPPISRLTSYMFISSRLPVKKASANRGFRAFTADRIQARR